MADSVSDHDFRDAGGTCHAERNQTTSDLSSATPDPAKQRPSSGRAAAAKETGETSAKAASAAPASGEIGDGGDQSQPDGAKSATESEKCSPSDAQRPSAEVGESAYGHEITMEDAERGPESEPDADQTGKQSEPAARDCSASGTADKLTRENFLACRDLLVCPKCCTPGEMVLNGRGASGIMAKCNRCKSRTTGGRLREAIWRTLGIDESGKAKKRRLHEVEAGSSSDPDGEERPTLPVPQDEWERMKRTVIEQAQEISALTKQVKELKALIEQQATSARTLSITTDQPRPTAVCAQAPGASLQETTQAGTPDRTITEEESPVVPSATRRTLAGATRPPPTWADIARANRPAIRDLPQKVKEEFLVARKLLQPFKPKVVPRPVPSYFGRISRGPLGALRKALRKCLPGWGVLGISFIGSSVCEILADVRLKERLVATMKLLGFPKLEDFNPMGDALKKNRVVRDAAMRRRLNLEACIRRWERCAATSTQPETRAWYEKQAQDVRQQIRQSTPSERRVVEVPTSRAQAEENVLCSMENLPQAPAAATGPPGRPAASTPGKPHPAHQAGGQPPREQQKAARHIIFDDDSYAKEAAPGSENSPAPMWIEE